LVAVWFIVEVVVVCYPGFFIQAGPVVTLVDVFSYFFFIQTGWLPLLFYYYFFFIQAG
jgi:hypothetical protein